MIIVEGNSISVTELHGEAVPVLFVADGRYVFVESDIVENELRVAKNFIIADRSPSKPICLLEMQGIEIPQELGDYLVANQNLVEKVLIVKKGDFTVKNPHYEYSMTNTAFEEGAMAGIFECGEILSRPLPFHQDNDETTSSSGDSKN